MAQTEVEVKISVDSSEAIKKLSEAARAFDELAESINRLKAAKIKWWQFLKGIKRARTSDGMLF